MAWWQMESLSGKKNGSSGASTPFSLSARLAGGDLLLLKDIPSHMINYLTSIVYKASGKGLKCHFLGRKIAYVIMKLICYCWCTINMLNVVWVLKT